MLDQTIRRLLELFPRGATDRQLIGHLAGTGLRVDAEELLAGLKSLADRGEIIRAAGGRWRIAEFVQSRPHANASDRADPNSSAILRAVGFSVEKAVTNEDPAIDPEDVPEPDAVLPAWDKLLSYYAATQRQDPRARIAEYADRHGQAWQLIQMRGHWWSGVQLRAPMDRLPEAFREALSKRRDDKAKIDTANVAAIGWPISIFQDASGTLWTPGLLLPAYWKIEGADLVLMPIQGGPSLNPYWIREVLRRSRWKEADLVGRLLPEGEGEDLGAISDRLRYALATMGGGNLKPADLDTEVSVAKEGLHNLSAIFLPDDAAFTRGAAKDLEALITWPKSFRQETALNALWGKTEVEKRSTVPLLSLREPTNAQFDALQSGLAGPLTVIQGPPGTGKSDVILALLLSAVLAGKSAIFASRNHQALDEVEGRIRALVGETPLFTRGRDAEGERDTDFLAVFREIASLPPLGSGEENPLRDAALAQHIAGAKRQAEMREGEAKQRLIHLELSELAERRAEIHSRLAEEAASRPAPDERVRARSRFRHFLYWVRRLIAPSAGNSTLPPDASLAAIDMRIERLQRELVATRAGGSMSPGAVQDPVEGIGEILRRLAPRLTRPDPELLAKIAYREAELTFAGLKLAAALPEFEARLVVSLRPIWVMSTLSVPKRVPLIPALFDYAIFDEASQCDIASALPIMARARSAVVVGDPMQLRFIPPLGRTAEHALMDATGLPQSGRAAFAQSVNSLFDFTSSRPAARRYFLDDQFRSAPAIVDYIASEFYPQGRLRVQYDQGRLRLPGEYKPGLAWEDVKGRASREDGGNINVEEAQRIAQLIVGFYADGNFDGSVGVLSPFNAQVSRIELEVGKLLGDRRSRLDLRIATIDRSQGAEADIVLFSTVITAGVQQSALTFLQTERRRLNVAISRARALCIVVGDLDYAQRCGIHHLARLAKKATTPWSPPRNAFDSAWERKLYKAMKARGLDPIPQYSVGSRYLDFALDPKGKMIDVEVDGQRWHLGPDGERKVADRLRDRELQGRGWKVLRFWVHELDRDMEGCLDRIQRELV